MPITALVNGVIHTMDPRCPRAWGLRISNGRVEGVLTGAETLRHGSTGQVIDLQGRHGLPGFGDAHLHLGLMARARFEVSLEGISSLTDALERLSRASASEREDDWLLARRWNRNLWDPPHWPTRQDLDRACRGRPVLVTGLDLHCAWASTAALAAAGLHPLPRGGAPAGVEVTSGPDGRPVATGILKEGGVRLLDASVPPLPRRRRRQSLASVLEDLLQEGVTRVIDYDGLENAEDLRDLATPLRIWSAIRKEEMEDALHRGLRSGQALSDSCFVGPLKLFLDGSLGSRTALMLEPYEGQEGNEEPCYGLPVTSADEVRRLCARAREAGLACALHAIGDRACRLALDVLESLGPSPLRMPDRVEHAQLFAEEDLPRMARAGLLASVQPAHVIDDHATADRLWGKRCRYAFPLATLHRSGVVLASGSDAPVAPASPLLAAAAAVMRPTSWPPASQDEGRRSRPSTAGAWQPQERLTPEQAWAAVLGGTARAMGCEDWAGHLSPGSAADVVILEEDPMTTRGLTDNRVLMTLVGGEVAWSGV